MNILCIGDIVGRPGREAVAYALPKIKKEHGIDFVIANAENASGGSGLIPKNADEILSFGVDVMTMGDHVWDKPEFFLICRSISRKSCVRLIFLKVRRVSAGQLPRHPMVLRWA